MLELLLQLPLRLLLQLQMFIKLQFTVAPTVPVNNTPLLIAAIASEGAIASGTVQIVAVALCLDVYPADSQPVLPALCIMTFATAF